MKVKWVYTTDNTQKVVGGVEQNKLPCKNYHSYFKIPFLKF